jgi:hypothetical protein
VLLSPVCQQSTVQLLGNRILNAFAGLFRTGLNTFSGVFGRDLCSMTDAFGTPLRGRADFLNRMFNGMTSLGGSFVHAVAGILTNRGPYTEDQQYGNPSDSKCLHRFSFSFTAISLSNIYMPHVLNESRAANFQ